MSSPPARTAQERERALAEAMRTRRERAVLRTRLAAGEIGIADVLESRDPAWTGVRVGWLLECLPGIGPARRERILGEVGIAPTRRVQGLGSHQRRALAERWSVSS